jgi:hypothetical protein
MQNEFCRYEDEKMLNEIFMRNSNNALNDVVDVVRVE